MYIFISLFALFIRYVGPSKATGDQNGPKNLFQFKFKGCVDLRRLSLTKSDMTTALCSNAERINCFYFYVIDTKT